MNPTFPIQRAGLHFCCVELFRMRDLPKGQILSISDLPDITFRGYNTKTGSRAWYGVRLTQLPDVTDHEIVDIHRVALSKTIIMLLKRFSPDLTVAGDMKDLVEKTLRTLFKTSRPVIFGHDGREERMRITGDHALTLRAGSTMNEYYTKRGCYVGWLALGNQMYDVLIHHPSLDVTEFLSPVTVQVYFENSIRELFHEFLEPGRVFGIERACPRQGNLPEDTDTD